MFGKCAIRPWRLVIFLSVVTTHVFLSVTTILGRGLSRYIPMEVIGGWPLPLLGGGGVEHSVTERLK